MTIYFDMDGTIADLYSQRNWLQRLRQCDTTIYTEAKPLVHTKKFAKCLKQAKKKGFKLGIISWTAKHSSTRFHEEVKQAKMAWLQENLQGIDFDEIKIVKYGIPKEEVCKNPHGILFDDDMLNRLHWQGVAYDEQNILKNLKKVLKNA